MSSLIENILSKITVCAEGRIDIALGVPLQAFIRREEGFIWVEMFDMKSSAHGDVKDVGCWRVYKDTHDKNWLKPDLVRLKVAALVRISTYFADVPLSTPSSPAEIRDERKVHPQ